MFDEKVLVDAADASTRWSPGVYRKRLSVEDAELFIKVLCYLPGKFYQVAGVQSAISPGEPAHRRRVR